MCVKEPGGRWEGAVNACSRKRCSPLHLLRNAAGVKCCGHPGRGRKASCSLPGRLLSCGCCREEKGGGEELLGGGGAWEARPDAQPGGLARNRLPATCASGGQKYRIVLKSKWGVLAGSESDFPWHPGAARKPWHAEMALITYNPREAMGHGRHGWQQWGGCGGLPWHGSKHAASSPAESPGAETARTDTAACKTLPPALWHRHSAPRLAPEELRNRGGGGGLPRGQASRASPCRGRTWFGPHCPSCQRARGQGGQGGVALWRLSEASAGLL